MRLAFARHGPRQRLDQGFRTRQSVRQSGHSFGRNLTAYPTEMRHEVADYVGPFIRCFDSARGSTGIPYKPTQARIFPLKRVQYALTAFPHQAPQPPPAPRRLIRINSRIKPPQSSSPPAPPRRRPRHRELLHVAHSFAHRCISISTFLGSPRPARLLRSMLIQTHTRGHHGPLCRTRPARYHRRGRR
jgi:hypothetical protein